jgi:transcriptional regulator with XRE-family HTH domain
MSRHSNEAFFTEQILSTLLGSATPEKGLTQPDIAEAIGVSQATVSRVLSKNPDLFKRARKPSIPKSYYADTSGRQAIIATNAKANIPPDSFDPELLEKAMAKDALTILGNLYANDQAGQGQLNEVLTAVAQLSHWHYQVYNWQVTDADWDRAKWEAFKAGLSHLPQVISLLIALHAKVVRDPRWATNEAWAIFLDRGMFNG